MTKESNPASRADGVAGSSVASGTNDAKPSTPAALHNRLTEATAMQADKLLHQVVPHNCDPELRKRLREFVVRVFTVPVEALGVAPPAATNQSRDCRIAVKFKGAPGFSTQYFEFPKWFADVLAEMLGVPVVEGQPWVEDGGAE